MAAISPTRIRPISAEVFEIIHYGVRKEDEQIDYDQLAKMAREHRPKMITVGAALTRGVIDFSAWRDRARTSGPYRWRTCAHRRAGSRHGLHPGPGMGTPIRDDHDAQDVARPAPAA